MYTISVEATFNAMHRVRFADGSIEPLHGHDWKVRAIFAQSSLNDLGMVVDFQDAQELLGRAIGELNHTDLGANPALVEHNPTAEVVARYIFNQLSKLGLSTLVGVEVTEAPGCTASYSRPDETHTD